MSKLCEKLEKEFQELQEQKPPAENCKCQGCSGPCSAVGPHSHRDPKTCLRDYCNYPCFKPPQPEMNGNQWSGEVHTDCCHPLPCKADCYDHYPPRDWSNNK